MTTGDIILLPFPFAELTNIKVRPAVVIGITTDKYKDVIVAAISSVVPDSLTKNEMLIKRNDQNGLRTDSVIKVDRIVTIKESSIITTIGVLSKDQIEILKDKFCGIIS